MYYSLIFVSLFLFSCGESKDVKDTKIATESNEIAEVKPAKNPITAEIDLIALEKTDAFKDSLTVHIDHDPVFSTKKTYKAVSFNKMLEKYFDIAGLDTSKTRLIFECTDNYVTSMNLGLALHHKGFIAFRDVDAPAGKKFLPAKKGTETKELAPFYLVWQDYEKTTGGFSFPYNLLKIKLQHIDE